MNANPTADHLPPRPFGDRIWPRRHKPFWNRQVTETGSRIKSWRAAQLLNDFGRNWEISDLKNRCVDWAGRFLALALVGIAAFAALLIVAS